MVVILQQGIYNDEYDALILVAACFLSLYANCYSYFWMMYRVNLLGYKIRTEAGFRSSLDGVPHFRYLEKLILKTIQVCRSSVSKIIAT